MPNPTLDLATKTTPATNILMIIVSTQPIDYKLRYNPDQKISLSSRYVAAHIYINEQSLFSFTLRAFKQVAGTASKSTDIFTTCF